MKKRIARLHPNRRVYIPSGWMKQLGCTQETPVEVSVKAGKLIVRPLKGKEAAEAIKFLEMTN